MKKLLIVFTASVLAACNNSADNNTAGNTGDATENKADSLEERKDTLLKNVDSTTRAKVDSIKERGENLKEHFDSTYEKRIDSVKGNNKQ